MPTHAFTALVSAAHGILTLERLDPKARRRKDPLLQSR
jgi:hypothetical protein